MPKRVDHHKRKSEILQELLAHAASEGLHNVTLRGVAAQAGISLRQVQYYFGTKDVLIQEGLHLLEQHSHRGVNKRLSALPDSSSAYATLMALFEEALPTDSESRQFHLLWMSYAMLSLTTPLPLDTPLLDGPNRLQRQLTKILVDGVMCGELRANLNAEIEAIILLGLINGLGTAVLLGQQTVETATGSFTHQIDRLL